MIIKAVVFDVDDTLYSRSQPFCKACRDVLEPHFELDWVKLYERRCFYGDEVFEASQRGTISMEEMYIYRLGKALAEFGQAVPDPEILSFEERYAYHQSRISLDPGMKEILDELYRRGLTLGVVTNGPSDRQRVKIHALGLEKWIPESNWCISGDVGIMKPYPEIFDIEACRLSLPGEQCLYIGDNFEGDVAAPASVGWHSVWYNPRRLPLPERYVGTCPAEGFPEFVAYSTEELFEGILRLLNQS